MGKDRCYIAGCIYRLPCGIKVMGCYTSCYSILNSIICSCRARVDWHKLGEGALHRFTVISIWAKSHCTSVCWRLRGIPQYPLPIMAFCSVIPMQCRSGNPTNIAHLIPLFAGCLRNLLPVSGLVITCAQPESCRFLPWLKPCGRLGNSIRS